VALISQYSSSLKDKCLGTPDDLHRPKITFPGVDPAIFELFIEWLYDGAYTPDTHLPNNTVKGVNIHAQAWVLGDMLGAPSFKTYAMTRLYSEYDSKTDPKLMLPVDVDYVFTHTSGESSLCALFSHLLVNWVWIPAITVGSTEEWDEVLQKHSNLRRYLMQGLRKLHLQEGSLQPLEHYLK
jgi:hypothetical protein